FSVFDSTEMPGASVAVEGGVPTSTLVSVGVPAYNRPDLLARTLQNLLRQTWVNIDIIISDNASSDFRVSEVMRSFANIDERTRIFHQPKNIGPLNNFFFVLKKSRAPFFMWAADDDYIEPWFVERALQKLWYNPALVLATSEARYITPEGELLDFVPEGEAFRRPLSKGPVDRLRHMLKHNFGNLVYGLFRKEALMQDGEVFWEKAGLHSFNEIPPLLYVACTGEILVMSEIGLYKQAPAQVHAQVKWELRGGRLPAASRLLNWGAVKGTWEYHSQALRHIGSALALLPLSDTIKADLRSAARRRLLLHFLYLFLGYKLRALDV
ncbi:MAG: glycosyltransferase family 2 protein, partial [Caldilineaceae bacterium]|nr:glycosyltransferase family 2 protein [Caldilineaceae bacterium]